MDFVLGVTVAVFTLVPFANDPAVVSSTITVNASIFFMILNFMFSNQVSE